jgi:hypothetical protein
MKPPPNALPSERVKLIDEPDFRLIEVTIGEDVEHVLEVRDGCDAMGVERWRKFETDSQKLKSMFGYMQRVAYKLREQSNAKNQ